MRYSNTCVIQHHWIQHVALVWLLVNPCWTNFDFHKINLQHHQASFVFMSSNVGHNIQCCVHIHVGYSILQWLGLTSLNIDQHHPRPWQLDDVLSNIISHDLQDICALNQTISYWNHPLFDQNVTHQYKEPLI